MSHWERQWPPMGFLFRWPIRVLFVLTVTFLVLYPYPSLFVRNIQHIRRARELADPNEPALAPLKQAFEQEMKELQISADSSGGSLLWLVHDFVHREIPYVFDWDNWGVADYLPTLSEVLERRRGDCGSRALVAAALLRSVSVQAELAADAQHMWVSTPQGETMGPTGPAIAVTSPEGTRVSWIRYANPRPFAVGTALYPWPRELIILAALWLACLKRGQSWVCRGLVLLIMLDSLAIFRLAGSNAYAPSFGGAVLGLLHLGLGLYLAARPERLGLAERTPQALNGIGDGLRPQPEPAQA